jgi:hypothetical protein
MIVRIWHGWTTPENADDYESLVERDIFVGIQGRRIHGLEEIELLRRDTEMEVEFITLMRFSSYAAIRAFAGDDYETAVVPPAARALLCRYEERVRHYEIRAQESAEL